MTAIFREGDLVQSIGGGPVMRVVALRTGTLGEVIVAVVLVHGGADEPVHYAPSALKIIGIDLDDDGDDPDDDHDE